MSFQAPAIPDINERTVFDALNAIKEIIEVREGLRGPDADNDKYMTLNLLKSAIVSVLQVVPSDGVSGYFDDGANFRVTFENGIITGVAASSGAGYSVS